MVKPPAGRRPRRHRRPRLPAEGALDDPDRDGVGRHRTAGRQLTGQPHGAVYSDDALEAVRDLAVDHDITVISDEIYKEITYDGVEATSLGTLDGMDDRTITVNGFSKAYSMTGWRLGYFAGPEDLVTQSGKVHGHSVSCAVNFVQHAGVEALQNTDEAVEEMVAAFSERRDFLLELLRDHDVDVATPQGAFYMMPQVDEDDTAWCEEAIDEAHVAAVPGAPSARRATHASPTPTARSLAEGRRATQRCRPDLIRSAPPLTIRRGEVRAGFRREIATQDSARCSSLPNGRLAYGSTTVIAFDALTVTTRPS